MSCKGSAYLFVLGAILFCMVFVSMSMRSTIENTKNQAATKTRLLLDQAVLSSAQRVINHLKIHDWREPYSFDPKEFSLQNLYHCQISLKEEKQRLFLFEVEVTSKNNWCQKAQIHAYYEDVYDEMIWNWKIIPGTLEYIEKTGKEKPLQE